jgi:hypothetical protein
MAIATAIPLTTRIPMAPVTRELIVVPPLRIATKLRLTHPRSRLAIGDYMGFKSDHRPAAPSLRKRFSRVGETQRVRASPNAPELWRRRGAQGSIRIQEGEPTSFAADLHHWIIVSINGEFFRLKNQRSGLNHRNKECDALAEVEPREARLCLVGALAFESPVADTA